MMERVKPEEQCEARRWGDWHSYQCSKKAKRVAHAEAFTPDQLGKAIEGSDVKLLKRKEGMRVCGIHDPEAQVRRYEKKVKRWEDWRAKNADDERQRRLVKAREEQYPKLMEALKKISTVLTSDARMSEVARRAVLQAEKAERLALTNATTWDEE